VSATKTAERAGTGSVSGVPDMFPPDSVIRQVSAEPALFLGAGRALLLQLAHPAVAQGVQDHSEFKKNPFKRLQGTLEATYAVVFGSEALANAVGRRIQRIHDYVVGPQYRANDPDNLMWVHATLLDTALGCYQDFVRPLSADAAEAYYREMMVVASVFGVPAEAQPQSLAEFRAYFDGVVAGLDVTDVGKDLGSFILDPVLPLRLDVPLSPLLGLQRRITLGRLPEPIRRQFAPDWSAADHQAWRRSEARTRKLYRAVPRKVRTGATALQGALLLRAAERHVSAAVEAA
jgi:uncharacterized protein (DUF2236 family)